jgi:ATP-dependent DNA helicase RecG
MQPPTLTPLTLMIDLPALQAATRLAALLQFSESKKLDFKRLGAGKVGKMLETICAFTNTEGGLLVVGVADPKEAKLGDKPSQRLWGLQENPEAFDELQRKCRTHFNPSIMLSFHRLPCTLRDGSAGHVALLLVGRSAKVHSVVDGGTWSRGDASNRQLSATEITDLSYRRGERSAESEPVPVPLTLLETNAWRSFLGQRALRSGSMAEQLQRVGLAEVVKGPSGEEVQPRRSAAVCR